MQLRDSDFEVLKQEAAARGTTVEALLQEYGHLLQPAEETESEPVVVEKPPAVNAPSAERKAPPVFTVDDDETGDFVVVEEYTDNTAAVPDEPELPPELEEEAAVPEVPGTFSAMCPHCGMDPAQSVIAVPTREDKILFLHCLLGDTVFAKAYDIFGGRVQFAFRMLRTTELDYLYQEALRAQRKGLLTSTADYYSFMSSLRVYVQLVSVTSTYGIRHVLPDGLTRKVSPGATQTWDELCPPDPDEPSLTLLDQMQRYINREILKAEPVLVAAREMCEKFNKLIVVLELNKNNDPFWNEIDTPP